ncbi:MAG TPA: CYTH domain-containing protein [Candidatus Paceibacterota bacterium]|nr:CYTH domain-containing protein [Candidatus Paceibacterota bacterium]
MAQASYEIEIKSLLGGRDHADKLLERMKAADPAFKKTGASRQLNHYFEGSGNWDAVASALSSDADKKEFLDLAHKAKDFSLRTRDADGNVLLVLKAAIDDTTSANGTARREFDKAVNMSIDELDAIILKAGFTYQAKWSREREEFSFSGANVTIDKNAGYGYLAEFEKIETDPARAEAAKSELRALMKSVGADELDQARLGRMFAYYNENWHDYYGTDKIFVIE